MKTLFLLCLLFPTVLMAEEAVQSPTPPQNAIYADLGFFDEALENNGMGFGIAFERVLYPHWSFRLRHGIIQRILPAQTITHFITSFTFAFYPKSEGLEGFNASLGMGYSNTQIVQNPGPFYQKVFPFVDIAFGYKILFWKILVVEPYLNWLVVTGNPDLTTTGIHQLVDIFGLTLGVTF